MGSKHWVLILSVLRVNSQQQGQRCKSHAEGQWMMRLPVTPLHSMSGVWRVRAGDVSTDGRWCFMIFKVTLGQAMRPHWALLRRRLEAICPSTHGDHSMWRYTSRTRDTQHPFLLQVTSYDRRGFLHGARACAHCLASAFSLCYGAQCSGNLQTASCD